MKILMGLIKYFGISLTGFLGIKLSVWVSEKMLFNFNYSTLMGFFELNIAILLALIPVMGFMIIFANAYIAINVGENPLTMRF